MSALRDLHRRALTLVEVLVTVVIVSLVGLAIMASIQAGIYFQQSIREENGATRVAADILDSTRKELFFRLQHQVFEDVVIDNRGTVNIVDGVDTLAGDDILGEAELRFYAPFDDGSYYDADGNRNEVGVGVPIPGDRVMVIAEVSVRWNRAGRIRTGQMFGEDGEFDREVVLATLLAP